VVDNGSADGTVEAVRERFPWAELVALPRNFGFAGGNNAGLARAKGRMLCLLNNDTIVQRDGLESCVRYLDAHPDVGAVGPLLLHPDGRKQNSIPTSRRCCSRSFRAACSRRCSRAAILEALRA
jgi:GT2 family glycosyltransferase